jgi:predicted anti-sigma-YlaC factor YlaD
MLCTGLVGCSIEQQAIDRLAEVFAASQQVIASDEDPEFVRDALPFGLKVLEALIVSAEDNESLLLSAAQGFTQYAKAFLEAEADSLELEDYRAAEDLRLRALRMYLRARRYAVQALEIRCPGIGQRLREDPWGSVNDLGEEDLSLAYWTAAAWGGAISLGLDRPELVADIDAVRALLTQVLQTDEGFGEGAIHEAFISIESLPELMGGSPERARQHFQRAVQLSAGQSASAYVSLASGVALAAQDRTEFVQLLEQALAVDPDHVPERRLANVLAQKRASQLLEQLDDLFLEPLE